jgi:beta-N-acetylhexosaminidase
MPPTAKNETGEIGSRFLVGLRPGVTLHPSDEQLLREIKPAGITVFKANFAHGDPYEVVVQRFQSLLDNVRASIGRFEIVVAIDHEGGRVFRLPPPFTNAGPAKGWKRIAGDVGHVAGTELASMGINVNLAPVLDLDKTPSSPAIGDRSFSIHPAEVSDAAQDFIEAQKKCGVAGCGKHFPGHGSADVDSHCSMPSITLDLATLRERDMLPFERLISSGIPMIMSAHLHLPALDPENPITTSRAVGVELLRKELGFDGIYLTDDLGMKAIQERLDDKEFALKLAMSGHDMFMLCSAWTSTHRLLKLRDHLGWGLDAGLIDSVEWECATTRVGRFIQTISHRNTTLLDASTFGEHQQRLQLATRMAGI